MEYSSTITEEVPENIDLEDASTPMVHLYGSDRVAVSSKQSALMVFGNRPHLINDTYVKDYWHTFLKDLSQTKTATTPF